jgi:hypothetical protein
VYFREASIGRFYADLIVNSVVLVEVKAAATIESYAEAQLLNYLKAAGGGVGMLWQSGPRNSRSPPVTRGPDRVGGCAHRMMRSAVGAAGAVARLSTFTTVPPE